MSALMMLGIVRMPYDATMGDEIARRQFHANAQRLADEHETMLAAYAKLRAEYDVLASVVVAASAVVRESRSTDVDGECPNCVTPWKCNGPHIGEAPPSDYDGPWPLAEDER